MEPVTDSLMTLPEVLTLLGVSRSTFDAWRRRGAFPFGVKLPNGSLRYKRSVVENWLKQLPIR
jgi:predicted DNA-binding transcriptional regulator AlpA